MKKILLILTMAIMIVCVQAQIASLKNMTRTPANVLRQEKPVTVGMSQIDKFASVAGKKNVPVRKELAKNERLMGLYTTDEYNEEGIALKNENGTFIAMSILSKECCARMMDGKITGIRFALSNPCRVNSVMVMGITEDDDIVVIVNKSTDGAMFSKGWNTVMLDAPCNVAQSDFDRIGIGFEYVEEPGVSPLSFVKGYTDECFIYIGDFGEGVMAYNGSSLGFLSVQAVVQLPKLPTIDIALEDMMVPVNNVAAGSAVQYAFATYNFGSENVSSYQIEVKLDGNLVKTVTEKDMPMPKYPAYYVGSITLPENMERGTHTLTAQLTKVNGLTPMTGKTDDMVSTTFSTYMPTDVVPRQKYLIEELTSHSCTYCPNGAAILEEMMKLSDQLAVVCVHGNMQSKDPFNTPECESILKYTGIMGFPSATFNRLYFGASEGILRSIGYHDQQTAHAKTFLNDMQQNSLPAFASVDIDKELSEDGNTLSIKVSGVGGEVAKEILKDYALTVYVIEDSLKFRQLNNGTWVSNYIHNHVLRKVATAINGDDIKWTSSSAYENTFEVALGETWVRKNLSVIAFISKRQPLDNPVWTDMQVSNANIVSVMENEDVDGGGNTEEDDTRVDVGLVITPLTGTTQLMGEGMSLNSKYVAGLNYGTYAPCIWNTETGEFVNFTNYEEGSVHSVNNNGTAVGSTIGYGGRALICYADGTSYVLDDNGGTNTQGADAWCISEDGRTIGGFYYYFEYLDADQQEGFYATFPCVWQDKKCITLSYPTKSEMGYNVDGAGLRWMSADGSVLLGYLVDDKATWPAVIWRKNAQGGYDCDPICKDYFETGYKKGKPYMMFSPNAISPNGEWVALVVQDEFDDSTFDKPMPMTQVARYNLKSGKLEVLDANQAMSASGISNDGSVLMYTNIDGIFGRVGYIWKAGETTMKCLDDMLDKVKGMPDYGANVPVSFAADGQTIMGFGIDQEANIFSYVVNLAELEKALDGANSIENTMAEDGKASSRGGIYTITGSKVSKMSRPGLYIVNGRKMLVK